MVLYYDIIINNDFNNNFYNIYMKTEYLKRSTSVVSVQLQPTAQLFTGVMTSSAIPIFNLADVSSNQFTTVLFNAFTLEDVGIIELIGLIFQIRTRFKGQGSAQWQFSGDGGSTWITATQRSNFNFGALTSVDGNISGLWTPIIQSGTNKFQVRFQVKANVGTVNTQIRGSTTILITYRKVVLF